MRTIPDPVDEFVRAVGEGISDGVQRVKWFILFAVVVLTMMVIVWVPIYVALGGV